MENALAQDTILLGEQAYLDAQDIVIAAAKQQLLIFDQDLSTGGFASQKRCDLMRAFLKNEGSTLTIILQYAEFLTMQCPRLMQLLAQFDYKMTIYITNSHAKIAKDCFILADGNAYVRRFHIDQARFKYALDDIETSSSLGNRFEELREEIADTISTTTLGL